MGRLKTEKTKRFQRAFGNVACCWWQELETIAECTVCCLNSVKQEPIDDTSFVYQIILSAWLGEKKPHYPFCWFNPNIKVFLQCLYIICWSTMQITIVQLLAFFARNTISIAQLFFLSHYIFPTLWIRATKEQANGIIALLELRLLLHAYSSFRYEPQKQTSQQFKLLWMPPCTNSSIDCLFLFRVREFLVALTWRFE